MAVQYTVRAEVVDIRGDSPQSTDVFLVDSNVWYWLAYSRASQSINPPRPYQTTDYPSYVNTVLAAGAQLFWSGLSLAELSHLIEKNEREIYARSHADLRPKEYRHNLPAERAQVTSEVEAAWGSVKTLAGAMTATVDEPLTDAALIRFKTQLVDGYDLFLLESMAARGVDQIITDDGDFCTVPDIRVFTANRNVLAAARGQNRLLKR